MSRFAESARASVRRWLQTPPEVVDRALGLNLYRLVRLAAVVIVLNLLHVLIFRSGAPTADPVVHRWKSEIAAAHLGMAAALTLLLLLLWLSQRAAPRGQRVLRRTVEVAGSLLGPSFAILVVAIDQAVTPSITPYLTASVLAGSVMLLRPWFAVLQSVLSAAGFWWAIGLAQADPVLSLTNRVNGMTTAAIGLLLTLVFWRKFVDHEILTAELVASRAELERRQAELEHRVRHDGLTGLLTRSEFRRTADRELALACRDGRPASLVLVDLDLFKRVNDTWGHPAGDAVLVAVARVLAAGVRSTDLVARLGGEEFILLLPSTDLQVATALAERLREQVRALSCAPVTLPLSASFGVASLPGRSDVPDELLHDRLYAAADAALYAAKRRGRDRVEQAVV